MKTNKISTLRSHGFSVTCLNGFKTMVGSKSPFSVDGKDVIAHGNGEYRFYIGGHCKKEIPYTISAD